MPPDLEALPPALTTVQAAELLGLSDDSLERAAKRGDAPVPFYRWGRSLRWPTEPIRRLLNGEGAPHHNGTPSETSLVVDRPDREQPWTRYRNAVTATINRAAAGGDGSRPPSRGGP